jgi:hypothetical protein
MSSNLEPTVVTDPALRDILDELKGREPIFHRPEPGSILEDRVSSGNPHLRFLSSA